MENDAAGFAMSEMRRRFERIANRHENGTAPRAVTAYQLFQTPAPLAGELARLLDLAPGSRVLEPSAGLGRLLDALQSYQPGEVVAVEMAAPCAGELFRQERTGVTIKQRDFLELSPAELGLFDAVIMNPPFHMRSDIRHIEHALQFVKPGGRLVAVCMNGPHREARLRPRASQWIDLDPGAFKESGTYVNAAICVFRKENLVPMPG